MESDCRGWDMTIGWKIFQNGGTHIIRKLQDCYIPHSSHSTLRPHKPGGYSPLTWVSAHPDRAKLGLCADTKVAGEYLTLRSVSLQSHSKSVLLQLSTTSNCTPYQQPTISNYQQRPIESILELLLQNAHSRRKNPRRRCSPPSRQPERLDAVHR